MERAAPPGTRESAERQAQTRVGTRLRAASGSGSDSPGGPGEAGLVGLLRRVPGWVLAGVVYAVAAVAVWWQVWSGHPASTMTCACGDPSSFVWFLAWPAYAISHGHSLFFSARVHVPGGMNLLDNTSVLALGVVLAPVTWLFGPIASLNVALTAAPVLSGLSAYGVLRRGLGVGRLAAFAGGLAFGFSPFMLRNEAINHLQASFLALVPLIFWCCYELAVAQRGRWWRWGVALGLLVAVQFFVGTEVLTITVFTVVIALLLGMLAGLRRTGSIRAKLPFAWRGFGLAVVVGVVLLAYPLWFAMSGPGHILGADWGRPHQGALGLVLWPLGGTRGYLESWKIGGYLGPIGTDEGYLGIAALVVVAVAAFVVRRPLAKLCAAVTVIAVWLSLGSAPVPVREGGEPTWLPLAWRAFDHLPVLNKLGPGTFAIAAQFCTVVAGALLVDELLRRRRAGVFGAGPVPAGAEGTPAGAEATPTGAEGTPAGAAKGRAAGVAGAVSRLSAAQATAAAGAVCLALVVPWLVSWHLPFTTQRVAASSWASSASTQPPGNSVVLFYPFPATYLDRALVWQAQSGMRYSIVGGRGIVAGPGNVADHGFTPGTPEGTMSALTTLHLPQAHLTTPPLPDSAAVASFRDALRHWGVTNVVMTAGGRDPGYARQWLTAALGAAPQSEDGAWVWNNVQKLIS